MSLKVLAVAAAIAALGTTLAIVDSSLFFVVPDLAYALHHLLAIAVGATLMAISWKLLGRVGGHRIVMLLDLLVGVGMVVIHVTKLVWGRCT